MSNLVPPERTTQSRIVGLFRGRLGYADLGDWTDRVNNRDVEDGLLKTYLARKKYSPAQIGEAIRQLQHATEHRRQSLYERNRAVYSLLRYGAKVQMAAGKHHDTVHFIDWEHPEDNDFACLFMAERDLGIFPLDRDDAAIAEILERIDVWWTRHMVGQTAPDPMSEDDCKKLWGRHRPTTVCFATSAVEAALVELANAKARKDKAAADEAEAKRVAMALLQDNEVLKSADGSKVLATWKNNKDSEVVDWQKVAEDVGKVCPAAYGESVKKHTSVKPGARVFRAKE